MSVLSKSGNDIYNKPRCFRLFIVLSSSDIEALNVVHKDVTKFLLSSIINTIDKEFVEEITKKGLYIEARNTPFDEENHVFVVKIFDPSTKLLQEVYKAIVELVG